MLKLQKLAVAAAISLMAMSAMASNFRAADQIYVPNAGHTAGGSGTFISDVFIANLSNDPVTISVIFSGNIGQQNFNDKFTLNPNERKEFVDFFANTLGLNSAFGQLIFNACKSGADCVATQDPTTGDSPNFRPISVETRIYAIPPGTTLTQTPPPATVGQLFAGIPWYNFASSDAPDGYNKIFITGIRNTGNSGAGLYRANIGLSNASQFSNTTLVVKLYAGNSPSTPLGTYQENFGPLGFHQLSLSSMFASVAAASGPTATNLFVTVEQTGTTAVTGAPVGCPTGCPAFLAYGSVLDGLTSDPTTLEPQFTGQLNTDQIGCIFAYTTAQCQGKYAKTPIRRAVRPKG